VAALVEIRALDASHCVAIWARTLIQIWRGVATAEATAEMNRIAAALVKADPFPATSLFVVEATSPPPEDQPRKEFAKFSRDIVSQMSIAVIVAEGGAFRSAIVRAVGVTLTALMPHRVPFRFVGDLKTGVELLDPYLPLRSGASPALLRAVEDLRAKITLQIAPPGKKG
jgi:hypothetical protein